MTFSVTPQDFDEANFAGASSALARVTDDIRQLTDMQLIKVLREAKENREPVSQADVPLGEFEERFPQEIFMDARRNVVIALQSSGFQASEGIIRGPGGDQYCIRVFFPLTAGK